MNEKMDNREIPPDNTTKAEAKRQEFEGKIKKALEIIFESEKTGEARVAKIRENLVILRSLIGPPDEFLSGLDSCSQIEDEEKFVSRVFEIITPIIDVRFSDPVKYELFSRKAFLEDGRFTSVNELLAYNIIDNTLILHVPPNETTSLKDKLKLLKDGFKAIAKIVETDNNIQEIEGSSWIIADHPDLIERLGFTLEGPIPEEQRRGYFGIDPREMHSAKMSRADFLKKYL
jgi:hypothetical protein